MKLWRSLKLASFLSKSFVLMELLHSMEFVASGVWVATSVAGLTVSASDISGMYLLFSFGFYQYLCCLDCLWVG